MATQEEEVIDRLNHPQQLVLNKSRPGYGDWFGGPALPSHQVAEAARKGYLDAIANRPFAREYDDAPPPWQRNYEIGRLWVQGFRAANVPIPEWPDHLKDSRPAEMLPALEEVNRRIGPIRPESQGVAAPDPDLPPLHFPSKIPRRLLRSRHRNR